MPKWLFSLLIIGLSTSIIMAQGTCSADVETALNLLADACNSTERNEACYGNLALDASLNDDTLSFDTPGDIIEVTGIERLATSPFDADNGTWGIGLLRVQGDFPASLPGQNVTMLVFGSIEVENAVDYLTELPGTINATARVRSTPDSSNDNNVLTSLPNGTQVIANGRNEAGDWVRILYEGGIGWTATFLINGLDEMALDVVNPGDAIQTPIQAIYLQTGIGRTVCNDAPDTIIIHTPESAGQSTMSINGVQMSIGSTVMLTLIDLDETTTAMQVSVLTGGAILRVNEDITLVPTGFQTAIDIDTGGEIPLPASPAGEVIPVTDEQWQQIRPIVESEAYNQLMANEDTPETITLDDTPPDESQLDIVVAEQFYPGGALNGRYYFSHVSSDPILGGNSSLLCLQEDFERTINWNSLTYPFDGSLAPRISDSRYGGTPEQHQVALNPGSTPDDIAFTSIVVSWVITSPTTFTYRSSSGQHRSQFGRQACDNIWTATWLGS